MEKENEKQDATQRIGRWSARNNLGLCPAGQCSPIFSFTEYGGFADQVAVATYSDQVVGAANVIPAVTPVYGTMSWVTGLNPQSSLNLSTVTGPAALPFATWTTISTLTHNNIVIPSSTNWGSQDIWGRFVLTDSNDGPAAVRLDSDDAITISFVETLNATPCLAPNPLSSICDDHFTFTAIGLQSLLFNANDGSQWMAQFRLWDLTNATQIGNTVYTGEGVSSSLNVQVLVSQVPEPATLSLFGLGLLGLGFARRRQLKG